MKFLLPCPIYTWSNVYIEKLRLWMRPFAFVCCYLFKNKQRFGFFIFINIWTKTSKEYFQYFVHVLGKWKYLDLSRIYVLILIHIIKVFHIGGWLQETLLSRSRTIFWTRKLSQIYYTSEVWSRCSEININNWN